MIWAYEAEGDHLHWAQVVLVLDLRLDLDRELLVGLRSLHDRADRVKHFPWQLLRVDAEVLTADILDRRLVNRRVDIDERVAGVAPLPELSQLDELLQDELVLIKCDRVVQ